MNRIGVIGIVVEDLESASMVNDILHHHSDIIIGRLGLPYKDRGISVISIIVDGTTDQIGSLTGQLGRVEGINIKSALTKNTYEKL
jgi:putative iron-only hydrogenase system regulator